MDQYEEKISHTVRATPWRKDVLPKETYHVSGSKGTSNYYDYFLEHLQ
jgi:hypothetical protein